jgi:hypothetical protein
MKKQKLMMLISALTLGFTIRAAAQDVLPEIMVKAVRYKYISAVDHKDLATPVKMLEKRAAEFNVRNADYYEEDYDTYFVSFYLPEGEILAAYDKDGKLLSTVEKYKDIVLPHNVRVAVVNRFPNWGISNNFYLVEYFQDQGATKVYKLTLQNGDKRMKVKVNSMGEFL